MHLKRTIIILSLAIVTVIVGSVALSSLRGSLIGGDTGGVEMRMKRYADMNDGDGILQVREIISALIHIVQNIAFQNPDFDIDENGTVDRADRRRAIQAFRALVAASCGNGSLEAGEECDDNNSINADGCSGVCRVEDGYACEQQNAISVCTRTTQVSECSDGIDNDGDGYKDFLPRLLPHNQFPSANGDGSDPRWGNSMTPLTLDAERETVYLIESMFYGYGLPLGVQATVTIDQINGILMRKEKSVTLPLDLPAITEFKPQFLSISPLAIHPDRTKGYVLLTFLNTQNGERRTELHEIDLATMTERRFTLLPAIYEANPMTVDPERGYIYSVGLDNRIGSDGVLRPVLLRTSMQDLSFVDATPLSSEMISRDSVQLINLTLDRTVLFAKTTDNQGNSQLLRLHLDDLSAINRLALSPNGVLFTGPVMEPADQRELYITLYDATTHMPSTTWEINPDTFTKIREFPPSYAPSQTGWKIIVDPHSQVIYRLVEKMQDRLTVNVLEPIGSLDIPESFIVNPLHSSYIDPFHRRVYSCLSNCEYGPYGLRVFSLGDPQCSDASDRETN